MSKKNTNTTPVSTLRTSLSLPADRVRSLILADLRASGMLPETIADEQVQLTATGCTANVYDGPAPEAPRRGRPAADNG